MNWREVLTRIREVREGPDPLSGLKALFAEVEASGRPDGAVAMAIAEEFERDAGSEPTSAAKAVAWYERAEDLFPQEQHKARARDGAQRARGITKGPQPGASRAKTDTSTTTSIGEHAPELGQLDITELTQRALRETTALCAFAIDHALTQAFGPSWRESATLREALNTGPRPVEIADPYVMTALIVNEHGWSNGLREVFDNGPCNRGVVRAIHRWRNQLAHVAPISAYEAIAAVGQMLAMLESVAIYEAFVADGTDAGAVDSRGCALASPVGPIFSELARRVASFRYGGLGPGSEIHGGSEAPSDAQQRLLNSKGFPTPPTKRTASEMISIAVQAESAAPTDKQRAVLARNGRPIPVTRRVANSLVGETLGTSTAGSDSEATP